MKHYKLLTSQNPEDLSQQVTTRLNDDWNIQMGTTAYGNGLFCQVLTKTTEDRTDKEVMFRRFAMLFLELKERDRDTMLRLIGQWVKEWDNHSEIVEMFKRGMARQKYQGN